MRNDDSDDVLDLDEITDNDGLDPDDEDDDVLNLDEIETTDDFFDDDFFDDELCGFDVGEMLKMDGYDECIVGIVERFGIEPIICYDKEKVIAKLMDDGMEYAEAVEFFEFNQVGAWMGDGTPCFITLRNIPDRKLD